MSNSLSKNRESKSYKAITTEISPKNNSKIDPKIRIYVAKIFDNENILNCKLQIANNDFNYLTKVMRQKIGDKIVIFNGKDGDFISQIIDIQKKCLTIEIIDKIANFKEVPNIVLAFAPVKNVRIDFVATKACELGVRSFQPIITQRSIVDKINQERFYANLKEACEQCGRNDFPQIFPTKKLENLLKQNFDDKILILCDESGQGEKASLILSKITAKYKEIIIFVGPEGGFTEEEFAKFRNLKNCLSLNLGPRILRSDTAIIASLTLVQEFLGDFNLKANFDEK